MRRFSGCRSSTPPTRKRNLPRLFSLVVVAVCAAASAGAQAPSRIATTADWLVASALFFHGKQIVIRQPTADNGTLTTLGATAKPVYVLWKERPTRSDGEIRGEFFDLGRIQDGDLRFTTYNFAPILEAASNGRWPGRDQIFVILGATLVDASPPSPASVRSIALVPQQFADRKVTLTGRFKGRNLYGDLPQGVGKSKWDFILQSADAAVWVTGLRPKGKDFDLDPAARVDTGRWLEVTGTVNRDGPMVWIAGESVRLASAPVEAPVEVSVPATPQEPPPAIIFSAPVADETDVAVAAPVRLQFSRDMIGKTFSGRVRIRYSGSKPPLTAPPPYTLNYTEGNRALEIRFKGPLERFQTVTIDLQEGITAVDGQPLAPWALTFTTGG
jgi:Big-like domain-containing protein